MDKRKDGRWRKVVTIDGKRISFYSREQTAKKAELDINKQMLKYRDPEKKKKLFETVASEWESEHYKKIEHSTAQRYGIFVNQLIEQFGKKPINKISAKNVSDYLSRLEAQGYSGKTIRDCLSVLKLILRHSLINRYIEYNVAELITPPKGQPSLRRDALTEEETTIIKRSTNCTFGLFAFFLLYSGCRKGEALALTWRDIDFENKIININKSVYFEGNVPKVKLPKTAAGERNIILLDALANLLKQHKKKTNEPIFKGHSGGYMHQSEYQRKWKKYQTETQTSFTAHQIRHTFATMLFEANINVKDAQALMGHSDISTTQNIYTHIRQSRFADTANQLNQYVESTTQN